MESEYSQITEKPIANTIKIREKFGREKPWRESMVITIRLSGFG